MKVPALWASIKPLSVLIAAITFAAMWNISANSRRKCRPILVGIAVGCALSYLGRLVHLIGDHLGPVIASGERAPMGPTIFAVVGLDLKRSEDLLALTPTIFGGALALAIIASIDTLLCTKLVMATGEARRDGDRVLSRGIQAPCATSTAGCFSDIAGGINIGASIANRTFGARSPLSVLINAVALVVVSAFSFVGSGGIPRAALSAVPSW